MQPLSRNGGCHDEPTNPAQRRAILAAINDAQRNCRDYADFFASFSLRSRKDMIDRIVAAGWAAGTGLAARVTDAGCLAVDRPDMVGKLTVKPPARPLVLRCSDLHCSTLAVKVVTWSPPGGRTSGAFCAPHADERARNRTEWNVQAVPVADGAHGLLADDSGTQVGTCRHCGHTIYLYPALASRPTTGWRGHQYDEPGDVLPVRTAPASSSTTRQP